MSGWQLWCWNGTPVWKVLNGLMLVASCFGMFLLESESAQWWCFALIVVLFIRGAALDRDMTAWREWNRLRKE